MDQQITADQQIDVNEINKKKTRHLHNIAIMATFGAIVFGYDTGVINGSLPFMVRKDQLNLSPTMEGLVTSSLLLGAAFGALIWGRLADKYGRKIILRVLAIIFTCATIGCALSPNADTLIAFRVILGLSVGGVSGIVPMFLGEIAPTEIRGSLVSQNELMIVSGQLLAYVMNSILGNLFVVPEIWRYMLALATIPAIALWIGSYAIPETPRWLVAQGRIKEALEVLKSTRDDHRADEDIKTITENVEAEKTMSRATIRDFGVPWVRRILIIGILLAITEQLAGINIMMYYGTTILEKAGFGSGTALIANIGNGVLSVVGTIIYMAFVANKVRRRPTVITGYCLTTAILLLISIFTRVDANSSVLPYIAIVFTMLFVFVFQMVLGPLVWLLVSEIFPLRVRGMGVGTSVFFLWLANFFVGLFFPILLAAIGMPNTFLVFVGLGCLCIVVSIIVTPETLGKTLEELEDQFRNYKKADAKQVAVPVNEP